MKKLLLVLLSALLVFALSGCKTEKNKSNSEETEEEKRYIANELDFEYQIKDGKAVIKKYIGTESAVVIPESIAGLWIDSIKSDFLEGSNVTDITFPASYTEFTGITGCDSLNTVRFKSPPENISATFRFCLNLTEIEAGEGGAYKSVDGVLYTADGKTLAAYPCGRTGSFTVPDGVEAIGKYAFSNSALSDIVLPSSLKTIGEYSFFNAEKLNEITVPPSVDSIGYSAFLGSGIKKAVLSEGLEEIKNNAFEKTGIKELYIPASVTSCGDCIADDEVMVSASFPIDGLKSLLSREQIFFRDETPLDEAFRMAENFFDDYFINGFIFTDLTGDNFPEAVELYGHNCISFYYYNFELKRWLVDSNWRSNVHYYSDEERFSVFYLCFDDETDTYAYYSEVYEYYPYDPYVEDYESITPTLVQCRLSFNENGVDLHDLFDEEIKELSEAEIVGTFDINELLSEYDVDFNDNYNRFFILTDRFSEKPDGSLLEKPLTFMGRQLNEYPCFESFYPDNLKLTAAGVDVLRGEKLDGPLLMQRTKKILLKPTI